MDQRSSEWFDIRSGRFTASRINELLSNGTRKMTIEELDAYKKEEPKGRKTTIECPGAGLYTYALEKATESLFGRDEEESFVSFDMQRGIDLEPLAFRRFKELKEFEFLEVKECSFFPYGKHAGASPDGLVGDDAVLEIKCPRRNKFFKIVANGIDEVDDVYKAQVQMQMLATNSKQAHFFNYYVDRGIEYWHEIIIPRDEAMISLIKERIKIATEAKLNFIKQLEENKQW